MCQSFGGWTFLVAPPALACLLLWRFPAYRKFRWKSILLYPVVMSLLIWGALAVVAQIASARVIPSEIPVILWFTVAWRLAWEIWSQTVGHLGDRWVRWGRSRRSRGFRVPLRIRLIPFGRATLTGLVFFTAFLSTVVTHRCKLTDGQDPQSVFNMPYEHIRIPTSDGLTLDGWFIPHDAATDRTIVICHGAGANKGNFIWFLEPLANKGYNVLFFDFRAHGSSDGRTTTYGICERIDVIAAVDWLKRHKPDRARMIVGLGSSQGSLALALAAAEDTRINAVVLDSPFVSPRELVQDKAKWMPLVGPAVGNLLLAEVSAQTMTSFFSVSAEDAVRRIGPRPVMVVHGRSDFVMPPSHSQRLYDAACGPREIWFGPGPHSNIITESPNEYADRLFRFLDHSLGPVPRTPRHARPAASHPSEP
jgi:pimeloyl-ACP methyl ester carboxylesterase